MKKRSGMSEGKKPYQDLMAYHSENKKWYYIRTIEYGIGEVVKKFDKSCPDIENVITSITLWDRQDSILKKHTYSYKPRNFTQGDINVITNIKRRPR